MDIVFGIELVGPRGQQQLRLGESDIYEVLEGIMGLEPEEDIDTVQMISPNPRRCDVLTKCQEVWRDRDLFKFMDRKFELHNGKKVFIYRPYEEFDVVKIKRIPVWWNLTTIERIMKAYGDVKNVRKDMFNSKRDGYKSVKNGNYSVKMKVREHIPSTLTINSKRIEIYYQGQPQTCWVCGKAHYKNECDARSQRDHINRF